MATTSPPTVRWRTQPVGHAARRTSALRRLVLAAVLPLWPCVPVAGAEPQTVCTITVNSADEKDVFRRHLPAGRYRFVELVERHRPDWLASACRAAIRCDVLVVSGHYDGGNEFYSDRVEEREFLPVDELERVSCSDSCAGLFARLKEVYLFGCNTLNPLPLSRATAETVRSLVRDGHSRREAELRLRSLNEEHGQSSRDRMRLVFKDVPVIYGFSSVAPLGPIAGARLERYLQATGTGEIGRGRPSGRLLAQFAGHGLTATQGMTDRDPHADVRGDVCRFVDDRLSDAAKLGFVHEVLQRQTAQARVHLDRIERFAKSLDEPGRRTPEVARAVDAIARDAATGVRFLEFARDADEPGVRTRMIEVAHDLGWLSVEERRDELARMLVELHARPRVGLTELDLACTLNREHELDGVVAALTALTALTAHAAHTAHAALTASTEPARPGAAADDAAHAALRACLGSAEGRVRTLEALVGTREADVAIAQAYLRHRPIADTGELRGVAAAIAGMRASEAQVRALEALGRHHVADREILERLVRLYVQTPSAAVQAAIAGVLIRADRGALAGPSLARTLRQHRRPTPPGDGMVDALIRQLQTP